MLEKISTKTILLTLGLIFFTALSFYLRLNFWPFVQNLGTYQGDFWYFYTSYGQNIARSPFFPIEYPIGYILIQKLAYFLNTTLLTPFTYENFILAHTLFLIPISILTVFLTLFLSKIINTQYKLVLIYLFLSPSLFITLTTNYDLLPVFFILLSLFLLIKKFYHFAFFSLALGAVIKLFPAFLIPLFILYLLSQKVKFSQILSPALLFLFCVTAINLPFYLYNKEYWLFPYLWQQQNPQRLDPNTISYLFEVFNLGSFRTTFFILMIFISLLFSYLFYRKNILSEKNLIFLSYFICFTAVFANHVNTPQYILWFLPFAAIFHFPSFLIWWPFDLLNSSILWGYFKLQIEYPLALQAIYQLTTFYFLLFYLLFIQKITKLLFLNQNTSQPFGLRTQDRRLAAGMNGSQKNLPE